MTEALIVDVAGLDDVLESLNALSFDKTGAVRETLFVASGEWLLRLPDRYSIGYKILPLLLSGIGDSMPQISQKSKEYMDKAGSLYEKEWEDRVKDEMDYTDGRGVGPERPRVGCRHLARDNTLKVVNKMVEGLADWTADKRARSAQVLGTFVFYTEDKITGYMQTILLALNKIMGGDEPFVMQEVLLLAESLGRFVNPLVYIDLVIPPIKATTSSVQFRIGTLRVLSHMLQGSLLSKSLETDHLKVLTRVLADRELLFHENVGMLFEVANVLDILLQVDQGLILVSDETSFNIFSVLATLDSTDGDIKAPGYPQLKEKVSFFLKFFLS
jgi:dynein assembly factor 5